MAAFDQTTETSQSGPAPLSSEDMLAQGRQLAVSAAPFQTEALLSALNQLRSRAAGSTSSIFPSIIGQLGDLRSTYAAASRAISRKLGFAGGGQTEREKGNLLARAGGQYGSMLQGAQQEGFSGLLNTQGNVQPYLSGSARPPMTSTATRTNPFAANAAGQLAGTALPGQISTIYGAFNQPRQPFAGGLQDSSQFTPEQNAGLQEIYFPEDVTHPVGTSYQR
jgi:hypothetical protein